MQRLWKQAKKSLIMKRKQKIAYLTSGFTNKILLGIYRGQFQWQALHSLSTVILWVIKLWIKPIKL